MKKHILLLLFFLNIFDANAQYEKPFIANYPNSKSGLGVDAFYEIGSNAITNSFANAYYLNQFINDEIKEGVNSRLSSQNRIGGDVDQSIYFYRQYDSLLRMSHAGLFFSLKNRNHVDANFSSDLFKLYFNGNKQFEDKTANADNLTYNQLQYQQFEIGFNKEYKVGKGKLTLGIGISALNGQNLYKINAPKFQLYTAPYGEYIDASLKMDMQRADSVSQSLGTVNGVGTSGALYLNYADEKNVITFEVSDIGFIQWNGKTSVLHADTSIYFEGVVLKNIFNSLTIKLQDSSLVHNVMNRNEHKSYTSMLPMKMKFSWKRITSQNTFFQAGVEYRFNANYFPLIYLKGVYRLSQHFNLGINMQYGGYGGFNPGVEIQKDFGKGYIFLAGTRYVNGYLFPSTNTSQGVYFSLMKYF